jgi:hypothetical protein
VAKVRDYPSGPFVAVVDEFRDHGLMFPLEADVRRCDYDEEGRLSPCGDSIRAYVMSSHAPFPGHFVVVHPVDGKLVIS